MPVPGRTFFFPPKVENHRWVIVSDPQKYPDQPVVIVNFTTFKKGKDRTCVVSPSDFPALECTSCIHYVEAKRVPLPTFKKLIVGGQVSLSSHTPEHVLTKIREGFARSKEPANDLKAILRKQGLIP